MTPVLFTRVLKVARALPESAGYPFAFEKRILAHVRALQQQDKWKAWAPAMWKAALCGLSILAAVGAYARFFEPQESNELLASELATTVMASVNTEETW